MLAFRFLQASGAGDQEQSHVLEVIEHMRIGYASGGKQVRPPHHVIVYIHETA
jgi:hypothetical protein